jgi:FkbM family methyltransferase
MQAITAAPSGSSGLRLSRVRRRLSQVLRFAASAYGWRDLPSACLAGLARESPFTRATTMTRLAGMTFPSLGIRPSALDGGRVWLDTNDLGQLVSYEEVFVDGCYDLNRVPFEPSMVVDCGAHVGFFSVLAAVTFPETKIIAIEPNPDNCVQLRRQCERFGSRISVLEAAVAVEDGTSRFEAEFSNSGRLVAGASFKSVSVKTISLGRMLAEIREPLLLKMDVEGEEQTLLQYCLPECRRPVALLLEAHHGSSARSEYTTLLQKYGFTVDWVRIREPYADGVALKV